MHFICIRHCVNPDLQWFTGKTLDEAARNAAERNGKPTDADDDTDWLGVLDHTISDEEDYGWGETRGAAFLGAMPEEEEFWDHLAMKQARNILSLSVSEMAQMLETDPLSVRRMEMESDKSTARTPAHRMVRLMRLYLQGCRPDDWPEGK